MAHDRGQREFEQHVRTPAWQGDGHSSEHAYETVADDEPGSSFTGSICTTSWGSIDVKVAMPQGHHFATPAGTSRSTSISFPNYRSSVTRSDSMSVSVTKPGRSIVVDKRILYGAMAFAIAAFVLAVAALTIVSANKNSSMSSQAQERTTLPSAQPTPGASFPTTSAPCSKRCDVEAVHVVITTLVNYRNDYNDTSKLSLLYNAGAAIGTASAVYAPMKPVASVVTYAGVQPGFAPPVGGGGVPTGYSYMWRKGGHPGRGNSQQDKVVVSYDTFVIAQYNFSSGSLPTVDCLDPAPGPTSSGTASNLNAYVEGWVNLTDPRVATCSNGVQLVIMVNNNPVKSIFVGGSASFNRFSYWLGNDNLKRSDVVRVALGPNGIDYCDSFEWDFSIKQTNLPFLYPGV